MLPWENKFDVKFLFVVFNGKIFWGMHPLCSPAGKLSLEAPVLVELITKW